jgi:hypothetical protein
MPFWQDNFIFNMPIWQDDFIFNMPFWQTVYNGLLSSGYRQIVI